jgi:radical SAM protein with 4Fe4S-binding SPASM domain
VVVWNVTRRCNLDCLHCYAKGGDGPDGDELTTAEGFALLDDLAAFGAPVVLFSGGEPLLRPDLFELVGRAKSLGLRAVLSTNGTRIGAAEAARLKELGAAYAGVSLDGVGPVHDSFRGRAGAFDEALAGIRHGLEAGLRAGLRFTIHRGNADQIGPIFDLVESEGIPRVCFYHLVYSGRGREMAGRDLDRAAARAALDLIVDRTAALHRAGRGVEVLTVDNHSDGPYLWLRMRREGHDLADRAFERLTLNGGNSSGSGIACVSWNGDVHPDQFWRHAVLGNVRERRFSEIWSGDGIPLLRDLKDRKRLLKGRCASCRWLDVCNGNFRVRADAATGDLWESDPACLLDDDEIAPDWPNDRLPGGRIS